MKTSISSHSLESNASGIQMNSKAPLSRKESLMSVLKNKIVPNKGSPEGRSMFLLTDHLSHCVVFNNYEMLNLNVTTSEANSI